MNQFDELWLFLLNKDVEPMTIKLEVKIPLKLKRKTEEWNLETTEHVQPRENDQKCELVLDNGTIRVTMVASNWWKS